MGVRLAGLLMAWILLTGASPSMKVEVHADLLTVHVREVALREVLEAVEEQSDLKFIAIGEGGEDKIAGVRVSNDFVDLPLEQGITRLLSGWDYALVKDQQTKRLKEVYIVARSEISPSDQLDALRRTKNAEDAKELEALKLALRSVNAAERLAALETMFSKKVRDRTVLDEARHLSLSDPHPEVREKALTIVRRIGPARTELRISPDSN